MGWRLGLLVWAIASALFVLGLIGKLPWVLAYVGFAWAAVMVLSVELITSYCRRRRIRQQKFRQQRRHVKQAARVEDLESQLSKPSFEVRLQSFSKLESEERESELVGSNMEFWQLEDEHSKTPPRPQTLFRYLLSRISRLVRQGR